MLYLNLCLTIWPHKNGKKNKKQSAAKKVFGDAL